MTANKRRRREKLWQENDGKCYWCQCLTVLPPRGIVEVTKKKRIIPSQKATDNMATIDHLRTKFDENRLEPNTINEERTVLCCWKCNNSRNRLHQLLQKMINGETSVMVHNIEWQNG